MILQVFSRYSLLMSRVMVTRRMAMSVRREFFPVVKNGTPRGPDIYTIPLGVLSAKKGMNESESCEQNEFP